MNGIQSQAPFACLFGILSLQWRIATKQEALALNLKTRQLARGALLLALGVMFQQLRLLIPLPEPMMTFIIGSLVNTCLALSSVYTSRLLAWVVCVALACIAFLQGHIIGALVPVIALGNGMFVEMLLIPGEKKVRYVGAPCAKTLVMLIGLCGVFYMLHFPMPMVWKMLSVFIPTQFFTGLVGVLLADTIADRIGRKS